MFLTLYYWYDVFLCMYKGSGGVVGVVQYFGLLITRSVVQFPLRTLIYVLSSSYMEI